MLRWTRRRMLTALLGGACGAAAMAIPGLRRAPQDLDAGVRAWLGELLPDAAAAATIGEIHLAADPAAARRARALRRELLAQPDGAARRELLWERRCRDLATDDVVLIDGWLLAATEAQLCAMARLAG